MEFVKVFSFEDSHTVDLELFSPNPDYIQIIILNKTHKTMESALDFFKKNSKVIEENLKEFGSLLIRGFPIATAEHFGSFVGECFEQWTEHRYEDAITTAVRNQIVPRVYSLQGQTNSSLIFHHEQAYLQQFPGKISFYCQFPAKDGGETGLCSSKALVKQMDEKYPEFTAKLEKEGVKYFANMLPRDTPEVCRRSWQNTLGTQDKAKAEEILKTSGYTCDWIENPDGEFTLRACSDIRPGIIKSPTSGARIWFNTTAKHWMNAIGDYNNHHYGNSGSGGPKTEDMFVFGNGERIDGEILEYANQLMEKNSFNVEWKAGDVILIDNLQMLHARREGTDGRKLFGSFFK